MAISQNQCTRLHKDVTSRPWHYTCAIVLSAAIVFFIPTAAFSGALGEFLGFFTGSSFYCSEDLLGTYSPLVPSVPVGDLYDNGIADCNSLGIDHLFSGFVCQFEKLVSDIFGQLYCGVQYYMQPPLAIFLTLFITFIGVGFLTSYLQFTAKEVVMIFFKFALVWVLGTQSDFMISYVFDGFIYFMQASVYVVLNSLMHNTDIINSGSMFYTDSLSPNGGLFGAMDNIINSIVSNSISASMIDAKDAAGNALKDAAGNPIKVPSFMGGNCQEDPLKIIIAIGISMPPLFMILVMTVVKLVMMLIRTLLGYLLCMTGIMFLLTLSPIFLSLGLFHITKGFFNSWLSLMVGFAAQVFIMFAFLAVALGLLVNSQFSEYKDLVMNYGQEYVHDSIRFGLSDKQFFCTLCEIDPASLNVSFAAGEGVKCAMPKKAIPPTALYSSQGIVELLSIKIFMLALVAYLFESILNLAPEMSSRLAQGIGMMGTQSSSPSISTGGVSAVPGKGTLQAGKEAIKQTTSVGSSGSMVTEALKGMLGMR